MVKKKIKETKPEIEPEIEPEAAELPVVKKRYSIRLFALAGSGVAAAVGFAMFALYMRTLNMTLGALSVPLMVAGAVVFKYYWGKTGDLVTEQIGKPAQEQVNSLCLYPDKIVFENVYEPKGFPWQCTNDSKKYYVNIWREEDNALIPFVLPDQQYYDPTVFAERVLALPAHRKIFERKENLFQKLKTGLLVLTIGIILFLIIVTTGGA